MKKRYRIFLIILGLVLIGAFFHLSILKAIGSYLDSSEDPVAVQRIFVLGGGNYDRGFKAARLCYQGYAPQIICTGSYISGTIKSLGLDYTEAELTRMRVLSLDIDSSLVHALNVGTSTMEESSAILDYCLINDWNKIIVVSDIFHTKRIKGVFKQMF